MEYKRYSAPDALAGLMLQHGLGDWVGAVQEHKLDLEALATMQAADLKEVIVPLGARMKLLKAVRGGPQPSTTPPPAPGGDRYADTTHQRREAFEHEEWEEEEGGRPPLGNVGMPARANPHHHHHPGGSGSGGRAAGRHPEPRPEEEPPLLYDPYYGPEQGRPPAASHHHHHNHPRRLRHQRSEKRGGAVEKPRKNTQPQSSQAKPTPPQITPTTTTTSDPELKAAKNLRYTPIPTATPAPPAGSPPDQVVDLSTTTSSDSPLRPPTPISPKSGGESAELSDHDDGTPHTLFVGGLPRNEDGSPTEFELSDILPPKALRAVRSVTKKAGFAFINVNSDKLLDQLINQRPPTYMGRRIVFKHSHRNVDANSGPSNPRREGGDASCRSANFPPPKGDSNCRVCILGEPGGLSEENNVRALIGTHLASKLTRVETGKDGRGMECVILTFATRMAADRALDMDGIEYMGRSLILIPESQMKHGEPAELSEPTLEEPEALPPPPHTTQPPPRRGSTSDTGSGSDGEDTPAKPEPEQEPEQEAEQEADPEEPEQVVDSPEEKGNTPPSETPKVSWDGGIGDLW